MDELFTLLSVAEGNANNKPKDELAHLAMLLPTNMGQRAYTFHKKVDVVVGRKAAAASIDLGRPVSFNNPTNHVLHDTLVELVENVGGDRPIDMNVRKIFPERLNNGLDTNCLTFGVEALGVSH